MEKGNSKKVEHPNEIKSRVGKLEEEEVKKDKEINQVGTTQSGVNSGGIQAMASTYYTRLSYALYVPKDNEMDHGKKKGIKDVTKDNEENLKWSCYTKSDNTDVFTCIKEQRVKQIWKLLSILTMLKMRLSKVSGKQIIQHTVELILEGYKQWHPPIIQG